MSKNIKQYSSTSWWINIKFPQLKNEHREKQKEEMYNQIQKDKEFFIKYLKIKKSSVLKKLSK